MFNSHFLYHELPEHYKILLKDPNQEKHMIAQPILNQTQQLNASSQAEHNC